METHYNCTSTDWRELLNQSVIDAESLTQLFPIIDSSSIRFVLERYPMRINPYVLSLIHNPCDPIWRQAIPDIRECKDSNHTPDPLSEEFQSPVQGLIHRYPHRVLFQISDQCAMYCRHCMRKRITGKSLSYVTDLTISQGIDYIQKTTSVNEVVLSGGDPLILDDHRIEAILSEISRITHIEIIRIHTRIPCVLPQRITLDLISILQRFQPIYINIQFNHPDEITPEASFACKLLADSGIALGSQTVLLKGINDSPDIMKQLMMKLLKNRIKPYYLHHTDPVQGTHHFRTTIEKGLEIMKYLRGNISGMAIPNYMIDLPGGKGKVPLLPNYIVNKNKHMWIIENYSGELSEYDIM
ncbi:MAG: KamA family radical SAM protein [Desulfobacterales bacterium]|nr:KamA family radical SAM protein [Desulfobacterales bacterium]